MAHSTEDQQVVKELDASTRLAYERTRVAYERTMQAWIRTATSLITFGFTVYKFFQIDRPPNFKPPQGQLIGSQQFGEILVLLGLGALLVSSIEYRARIHALEQEYAHKKYPSLSVFLASAMSILGVLALLSMFFRW
jgi:putative membrane protein